MSWLHGAYVLDAYVCFHYQTVHDIRAFQNCCGGPSGGDM